LIGSALCLRKMIVSIPVISSPKFLDFIFVLNCSKKASFYFFTPKWIFQDESK